MFNQEGFVPPFKLDIDAANVLTGSEHIFKACASKHNLTTDAINDIIKDVLILFGWSENFSTQEPEHCHIDFVKKIAHCTNNKEVFLTIL